MTPVNYGNAVDELLSSEDSLLLHCCNAQGVMNSGIAKEIRERIPEAYHAYLVDYSLGAVTYGGSVANLVAQEYYGYNGGRYVHYGVLANCLFKVAQDFPDKQCIVPYKMASDRAGGDWNIVLELCEGILGVDKLLVVRL